MATELLARSDDRAAHALVAEASGVLRTRRPEIPQDFIASLLSRTAPEDLLRYPPRELAALAESAWSFLSEPRQPGVPKIRFALPADPTARQPLADVAVLEIINDDMPFLLDSVLGELTERGLGIRLVSHPVFGVERDASGALTAWQPNGKAAHGSRESFIHLHVDRIDDRSRRADIMRSIERALADVRIAVRDWQPMKERVGQVIAELKANPPPLAVTEVAEAVQFLEWLIANNFTLLGVRDYVLSGRSTLVPVTDGALGVMRDPAMRVLRRSDAPLDVTPEIAAFLEEPKLLIVTKAAARSRVHRRVYMDYIGVKRFDDQGRLIGEFRIVGLFTSTAYTGWARAIPYLRRKIAAVTARAGFDPDGHSGKALANVLESYPRDELFQIDEDTLYQPRAHHHAARRAAAPARVAAARPFRSLCVGDRLCAARPLRQQGAGQDRRSSRRDL